jgi:hypothetical protein
MKVIFHVAKLIYRKYHLSYVLLVLSAVLTIPVLSKDWIVLHASINLNLPFSKNLFPEIPFHLSGFQVMGYFSATPLLPIVLVIFLFTRKQAWLVTAAVTIFMGVYLANLSQLFGQSKGRFSELIILKGQTFHTITAFFILFTFLIFFSFLISKKA